MYIFLDNKFCEIPVIIEIPKINFYIEIPKINFYIELSKINFYIEIPKINVYTVKYIRTTSTTVPEKYNYTRM